MTDPGDQYLRGVYHSTDPLQAGLFEPRARNTDPDTSHQAAASMVSEAAHQRARIFSELHTADMTADELDERIGWRITTAGRRLSELLELGLVRRTGVQRRTRSNRMADVWALR